MTIADTTATTRAVVETYLQRLTGGESDRLAELFAEDVDWLIPGNQDVAPWVGQRHSRAEVADFYRLLAANVEPLRASVDSLLVEREVGVIVGSFASRMRATDQIVESPFSITITVQGGQIVRYRLLEDSQAVVAALTP